ncbi:CLUMA_CG018632, isoform A [Clunio marinus]|uniref:CLUMA_CG018632, isoform A n=1 Tax=Clunio marinus TaxID=568069 RepID=A0A1J1J432_9DIPT|nr:CLUMA_CG018632, isoform A [Clunio marinus]
MPLSCVVLFQEYLTYTQASDKSFNLKNIDASTGHVAYLGLCIVTQKIEYLDENLLHCSYAMQRNK